MGAADETAEVPVPPPPTSLLADVPAPLRDAVDELLGTYLHIAFACALRRARGDGPDGARSLPRIELPRAMRPFLRLRPDHAVAQSAVRGALFELADADAPLRRMIATEATTAHAAAHPDAATSLVRVVADAVVRTERDDVTDAVALALATGGDGAAAAITAAAAAVVAGRRSADADEAATADAEAAKRRDEERTLVRLRADLQRAQDAARRAEEAAADARERRDELRRANTDAVRRAERAEASLEQAEEQLRRRRDEVSALQASVHRERAASRDALDREERLRAELDRVRALRVPDLDGPAAELEAFAARLRGLQEAMATGDVVDAVSLPTTSPPGTARRTVALPPGMRPDTAAFVRWAVGRREVLVLVDGYNVCLQAERGWSTLRGSALRDLLVARLTAAHRPGGAEFHVVFDGDAAVADGIPVTSRFPEGVRWEFTRDRTADDRLVELCASLPAERTIVVVTSDRELQSRVAAEGAVVVPSPVLLEAVGAPQRR